MSRATFALRAALPAAVLLIAGCSRHPAQTESAQADLVRGGSVYREQCAACHGADGEGTQIAPALRKERLRLRLAAVRAIVLDPLPPMPKLYPSRITLQDVRDVSAFVESLK